MIPLFTSIPPRATRKAGDGSDISSQYASACVRSWRSAGFEPVTVNARSEVVADVVKDESVRLIPVDRDARSEYGKPLVFVSDFLNAACTAHDGPVAITNADIMLDVPKALLARLEQLRPGESFVAKRQDVDRMESRTGTEYAHGYDFFVFHTADLRKCSVEGFVFGMPWWDHVLPVDMYLKGVNALPSQPPVAFHLLHTERWDFERWVTLGRHFIRLVRNGLQKGTYPGEEATRYASRLSGAVEGPDARGRARWVKRLRRLAPSYRLKDDIEVLTRVANANVAWLDDVRLQRRMPVA